MLGCTTHGYQFIEAVCTKCRDTALGQSAEIDRLRAERDTWRNAAESHEPATSLRQAEFARMDLEVGRLRAELVAKDARIKKTEAELIAVANARGAAHKALRKRFDDAVEAIDLKDKELIQERTMARDLRKRVGELENKNSYNLQIVREATARIAELEAAVTANIADYNKQRARAERAEAEADSLRNTIDNMRAMNIKLTWEASGRVLAAEAERDALHLFSGAQAAVIKEMREALELVLKYEHEWLVPSSLADVARAALAPSPAGWEERHEMTSIGDKEPDADSAGREG